MAGLIPRHFIDELVGKADIVELIGSRVPLKKAGREYKACCPFHDEKTPSFWVSPDKQFYHCFGCGAHGTALSFLMNYDHLPFVEAVEELASRLGMEVPREASAVPAQRGVDEDLYALTREVAGHYAQELARSTRAREYVQRRGLTAATVELFQIGYATASWNDVLNRFGKDDEARRRLAETGLIIEKGASGEQRPGESRDRFYDRFRDRLMFPIRDVRGRTIGFGGRIVDQGEPKYLNSPETVLFHKGRELYGLYEVRQNRAPLKRLLIVEGYMDVVRLHQAGIHYAVATLGTATTAEHLARAFRMVSEVIFSFDGDRAGRAAAWRALNNVLPEARAGREIRFLFLPEGEDPDSIVGREGAAAFERRLAEDTLSLADYLVQQLLEDINLEETGSKAKLINLARPLVERMPEGVFRELILNDLAKVVEYSREKFDQVYDSAPDSKPAAGQGRPATGAARAQSAPLSAGRGGVVRQSVQNLIHYPRIAAKVDAAMVAALENLQEPGASLLHALLRDLHANPLEHTAQLLERWRERDEYGWLIRLASAEILAPDAVVAGRELAKSVEKLLADASQQRLNELIVKAEGAFLSDPEKQELQRLMAERAATQRKKSG